MTTTVQEFPDRFEFLVDGRSIGFVYRYILEGLRAHDGGSHQLRPARQLLDEIERREHPREGPSPF